MTKTEWTEIAAPDSVALIKFLLARGESWAEVAKSGCFYVGGDPDDHPTETALRAWYDAEVKRRAEANAGISDGAAIADTHATEQE